jgi:hypothetical protein
MRINRKLCYLALIVTASLLIPDLDLVARGRRGYSRGSMSRYSGFSSTNRGSMRSYSGGSNYNRSSYNRSNRSSSYNC